MPTVSSARAEYEAVRLVLQRWGQAFHSKDVETLVKLYSPDAVRMVPTEPPHEGIDSIRSGLERELSESTWQGLLLPYEGMTSGDLHYTRGMYRGWTRRSVVGESAEPVQRIRNFIFVLQRRPDRSWKVQSEIWSESFGTSSAGPFERPPLVREVPGKKAKR